MGLRDRVVYPAFAGHRRCDEKKELMMKTVRALMWTMGLMALVSVVLAGCFSRSNDFMDPEQDAYRETTERLLDTWTLTSLQGKPATTMGDLKNEKHEYIGPVYAGGDVEFVYDVEPSDISDDIYPTVRFRFFIDENTLAEKRSNWREEYPDMEIDGMDIIVEGVWYVSPDGSNVRIIVDPDNGGNAYVEATGAPEDQVDQFAGVQSAALATALAAGEQGAEGGLVGRALSAVVEETVSDAAGLSEVFPPQLNGMFSLSVSGDELVLQRAGADLVAARS